MKGIEKIIERINSDSDAECAAIAAAAEAEVARIRAEYEKKTVEAEAEIDERSKREAEGIVARLKSSVAMTRRNIIASERSRNVDAAYDRALETLVSLPRDKYVTLLVGLATAAVRRLVETAETRREKYGETTSSSPFELVLNARDRAEVGEAVLLSMKNNRKKELGTDAVRRLTLSESTANIDGGLIVRAGAIEENCSLSLLIEGLHDTLDAAVYKTLYPEG